MEIKVDTVYSKNPVKDSQAPSNSPTRPPVAAGTAASELGWTALLLDSGADVAIVDTDGRILYACQRIRWWSFALEGDAAVGRTLGELLGKEIGDERLEYVRKACTEGVTHTIVGMSRGVRTKTTIRPFQPEPAAPNRHALLVGRPAPETSEHNPAADGPIFTARNIDLGPLATLTPRELEVLSLIGQGLSTAQIATTLCRSVKTVEAHRLALGLKLKVRNRVELARIALRAGLMYKPTTPATARSPREPLAPKV